jgi:hypothetical protein
MASETMASETPPESRLAGTTTRPEASDKQPQSPAGVIIGLRKDLAEFQRTSSKQALREALREELREACKEALLRGAGADRPDYPNIEPIVEYLKERGVIRRSKLSRAQIRRRLKSVLPPSERDKI